MDHISLEIFDITGNGSKFAVLPENASITITDTSEIFGSGDVWSFPFTLNIFANIHIFNTASDMHGNRLHELINRRRARLWVEGIPLYLGRLKLDDEVEVDQDGNIDVSIESGQKTFKDMIDGAKANQVPLMNDVLIGMAAWRKRWTKFKVKLTAIAKVKDIPYAFDVYQDGSRSIEFSCDGEDDNNSVQQYPRMVFPKGSFKGYDNVPDWEEDCINTDFPYDDAHPYCNIALCYQKSGYEKKDESGNITIDYSSEPEPQRGYEYMPANRVNSAPNFFVIYWIRSLMKHLNIFIEENQMMDVEDLRRLFFVNTKCAYEEPKKLRTVPADEKYGKYYFPKANGRLKPEQIVYDINRFKYIVGYKPIVNAEESGFTGKNIVDEAGYQIDKNLFTKVTEVEDWSQEQVESYLDHNNYYHKAYATSECFPDVDISEVIDAIEKGFGVRFLFSEDFKRVRIVLLRNLFRSKDVQHIVCDIESDVKQENSIRGFRMTYGESDDTHFFYKGFDDMLPHKKQYFIDNSDDHDYSFWNLNAEYSNIIKKVSAFDKTCFVTPNTGNAFGIKIDKEAKRYDELHPSLFEYAAFMDAEDGDCTGDEETIETINLNFKPAIMNDLNMESERSGNPEQLFALFVEESMRPRRFDLGDKQAPASYNDPDAIYDVNKQLYKLTTSREYVNNDIMHNGVVKPGEFAITSDMFGEKTGLLARDNWSGREFRFDIDGHLNEGYRLYLQDNYAPNDEGVSPIETHDWGLTLGIMRGSGSDAYINYESDPQDGEGNDTWDITPGSNATVHPDTCDSYGKEWIYSQSRYVDYNNVVSAFSELFPDSHSSFRYVYEHVIGIFQLKGSGDMIRNTLFVTPSQDIRQIKKYVNYLSGHSDEEILALDAAGYMGLSNLIIELDSSQERFLTLRQLCLIYYYQAGHILIDNGVDVRYARLSLKLRAEKPNPYFNPALPETHYDPEHPEKNTNPRYLHITNENLQGRGLIDTLYKEYSYWERNARVRKLTAKMELAQLLSIDKTKKAEIGDTIGLIKKMQYTVSKQTGLGPVTIEQMYI